MLWKTEIQELLDALAEAPEEFRISDSGYCLIHVRSKVVFWIASDPKLYEPVRAKFSFADRRRFRRAIRGWKEWERQRRLASMFNPNALRAAPQRHQGAYAEVRS